MSDSFHTFYLLGNQTVCISWGYHSVVALVGGSSQQNFMSYSCGGRIPCDTSPECPPGVSMAPPQRLPTPFLCAHSALPPCMRTLATLDEGHTNTLSTPGIRNVTTAVLEDTTQVTAEHNPSGRQQPFSLATFSAAGMDGGDPPQSQM